MPPCELSPADIALLVSPEEAMWQPETRFDMTCMAQHWAADNAQLLYDSSVTGESGALQYSHRSSL